VIAKYPFEFIELGFDRSVLFLKVLDDNVSLPELLFADPAGFFPA
jgi:hypothetical protein